MEQALGLPAEEWAGELPFGAVVARGELVGTMEGPAALAAHPGQAAFGDFGQGRWGHIYEGLRAGGPVPWRGAQGFFFAEMDSERADKRVSAGQRLRRR